MKTRKTIWLAVSVLAIVIIAIVVVVKSKAEQRFKRVNPAFREYISGFTTGIISVESTIKIRLALDFADSSLISKEIDQTLFDFSPNIKGKAYWIDGRTIEFRPAEKLPPNKFYDAQFYLSKLIQVPDSLKTFEFQFKTMTQDFDVNIQNHKAYSKDNLSKEKMLGVIRTADVCELGEISKVLEAKQNNNKLPIKWSQDQSKRLHYFVIDSVVRGNQSSEVDVEWNGKPIDSDKKGESKILIPSLSDFSIINSYTELAPEQFIVVHFSDPLDEEQNLDGLVSIGSKQNLRFYIEDNELRIYPNQELTGTQKLSILSSVKNFTGKKLSSMFSKDMDFENNKPLVRFVGSGVIMPSSEGTLLPFEAVNLKAVDIKIIKIYESNMLQFLQVNDLGGSSELSRVGRTILKKTIPLTGIVDYNKWTRFTLDISDLIKLEQGAIYSVKISFNKNYSTYPCTESNDEDISSNLDNSWNNVDENEDTWYYYSEYYYNYGDEDYYYDWDNRDNPCFKSYYNNKSISQNILSSNLGIICKKGAANTFTVFVNDLLKAEPLSDVELEFYDYQQKLLGSTKTNSDGIATMDTKRLPFVLVAKKDEQRGYLKIIDGNSLSLSSFDVSGETTQKGLKGFIYGERGVWRPGDSLYITFVLEDKNKMLPENYPVVFDLVNPNGVIVKRLVKTSSVNGFYNFNTITDPNAPTGNWSAKVKAGGAEFIKTIKIETIKPNRLKINLTFDKPYLSPLLTNKAKIECKWLHGAIARNLKTDINVTLTKTSTIFKGFPNYTFDDSKKSFSTENVNVFSGKLNEDGIAEFTPQLNSGSSAPGILKAYFETKVFEEGGDFSIDRFSMDYFPYESFAGISYPYEKSYNNMLYTDKDYWLDIANVTYTGKAISNAKLKVSVYKLQWRWWWDNTGDNEADYISDSYASASLSGEVQVVNGKAKFKLKIPHDDWGRYYVRVTDIESGHSCGENLYFDWYGYERAADNGQNSATMLTLKTDKEKYKVGEEVKVSIPSSLNGKALVSIETGSKMLQSEWINTKNGTTVYTFKAKAEMAPNIYVNITLLQPHGQTINNSPIRMYGVVPVFIEDPNTHLRPHINCSNVFAPGKNASITVNEENGKAMTYTLAIVDEGLLDLTRFKTPDLWSYFYSREALGVKTWDLYDLVIGAYGAEMQRIISVGGDEDGNAKGSLKANRFKPMVKFIGPIELKKGQSKTHNFKIPEYFGSVRVMVVAGNQGAYGSAEKTVAVRKPLMILSTLPRVVGTGEKVNLPVTVFAMEKNIQNVSITVTTNTLFSISGKNSKQIKFNATGDKVVTFELKAKEMVGIGKIKVEATCGTEKAISEIELDVRNPNPKITNVIETVIKPGGTWDAPFSPVGISGTNKGIIEISTVPPINLEKRLSYLIQYPYGCIEQTTSAIFPQLFLSELCELSKVKAELIEQNIKSGINRLRNFQISNGGLGYWQGDNYSDDWGTSYAGHFMLLAEQKGYALPVGFIQSWKKYQKQRATSWVNNSTIYNDDLVQAYRLYTLALAKSPEWGAMNRLFEEKNSSLQAKWRLAAAYAIAGKTDVAEKIISKLPTNISPYREMYFTYGSDIRDKAMFLETYCLLKQYNKAMLLVKDISTDLCSNDWMSTQTTAYSLLAVSQFISTQGKTHEIYCELSVNGQSTQKIKTPKTINQTDLGIKNTSGKNKLSLKNKGQSMIYARIILEGVPAKGEEKETQNNLRVNVAFRNLDNSVLSPDAIPQGTDFYAEVTVSNPSTRGEYNQMALSQIFPSGWEIINRRVNDAPETVKSSLFTYQDIRDDRVYTFFSLPQNQSKIFRVLLNASYIGEYYLPAVSCEAMYDNTISASTKGKWIKVVE